VPINVTLKHLRVTFLLSKNNTKYKFWVSVCSLSHPACSAHAPYYTVTCGLSGCAVFSILSHKRHDFWEKNVLSTKCVFWFSLQLLSETFPILRIIQSDIIINVRRCSCTRLSCQILMTKLRRHIFKNYLKNKFYKIRPLGAEFFQLNVQTDRHNEANSSFSRFCKRA